MILRRAPVIATRHAVSSGHELATRAAIEILENGGNAVDAGVAAGIALGVLQCDIVNIAGVAPIILRMAETGRVVTIDGLGHWPRSASAAWFEKHHEGQIPEGLLRTVVPAAPAAWIKALSEFGTISFGEAASAAIRYARDGFPAHRIFVDFIRENEARYRRTPATARIFLPGGRPPQIGETFIQQDLAATLQYMVDQEAAAGASRERGLAAAHDAFYRGDIATTLCRYHERHNGWLRRADLSDYQVRLEEPVRAHFAGCDFYCCGAWSQGISMAQTLTMLEALEPNRYAHQSIEYVHTLTELFKLAFADREAYVADPRFVDVPVAGLLDPAYAGQRLGLIDPGRSWPELPPCGNPRTGDSIGHIELSAQSRRLTMPGPASADTSQVCVIDRMGNLFAATPSDTSADTEVIPGTGLSPSSRGSQSRGVASSINAVAPGKRPRLTPNPVLALRDGKPLMTIGTPGGDVQIQALAQVLVSMLIFRMGVQEAIEAPRFATYSFPSSFAPNDYHAGLLMIEERLGAEIGDGLQRLGHRVEPWQDWTWKAGGVCAIMIDQKTGELHAGADPRRASSAAGR